MFKEYIITMGKAPDLTTASAAGAMLLGSTHGLLCQLLSVSFALRHISILLAFFASSLFSLAARCILVNLCYLILAIVI